MPLDWVPSRDEVVRYGSVFARVIQVYIHSPRAGYPEGFVEVEEIVEKPPRRRARRRMPEERVADVLMGKEKEKDDTSHRRLVSLLDLSPLRVDGGGSRPGE